MCLKEQTKTAQMRKYFSYNVRIVRYVYKYSYKKQDCHLVFVKPLVRIHAQDVRAEKQEAMIQWKIGKRIRRNHEILGVL